MDMPTYVDGVFYLYKIVESNDVVNTIHLENINKRVWFCDRGITDRLRSQLEANNVEVQRKIRIPQYKDIGSMNVLQIDDTFYKVYNAYHFTDTDGFKKTDITLVNWSDDND